MNAMSNPDGAAGVAANLLLVTGERNRLRRIVREVEEFSRRLASVPSCTGRLIAAELDQILAETYPEALVRPTSSNARSADE